VAPAQDFESHKIAEIVRLTAKIDAQEEIITKM
jgi:hypothetical protein